MSDKPQAFKEADKKTLMEKGMRTVLKLDSGQELTFMTLNKAGQKLLKDDLPAIYKHMGIDVVNNCEFILS